ncbi:MAG: Do family serine endopeptidase [Rhodocyclaceae bacterium]|nr:Do family serine endopeptidase [Rhodocyclaceae bacterium]
MNMRKLKLSVIALCVAAAVGGAYSFGDHAIGRANAAVSPGAAQTALAAQLPDLAGIVEKNGPAVVNISATGRKQVAHADDAPFPGFGRGDPFSEFFRQFRGPRADGEMPVRGQGSGFIVSADGTVLTNAHVVDGADEVTVKLTDRREFRAKVVGLDRATDVAVLRIDARDLPAVKVGDPAATRVGEWVLAIGAPFGFENSATAGIVSAKSRSLPDGSYVPFIQTDVAVNPGNSGGPLFNMAGEVIGINSQIYSSNGGYQGLSFAIPIDVAMNVGRQIVATGKVQRGRLGVAIQPVDQALADSFGLQRPVGALVNAVEKGSPAAQAGLEPGDVILGIDGKEIAGGGELPAIVAGMAAGEVARLDVWRNGDSRRIEVRVGSFEETEAVAAADGAGANTGFGVAVRPLSPHEQRAAGTEGGLLVQDVAGAAARAGIRPGDIILSVNGQRVKDVEQLQAQIAKSGKRAAVLVERGEVRLFVPVEIG